MHPIQVLIQDDIISRAGGLEALQQIVATQITSTINHILDGRSSLDDIESNEKTHFGVGFQRRFLKALSLPQNVGKLDTTICEIPFDIKCTLGGINWEIPLECHDQWTLLLKVDYRLNQLCDLGIFRADVDRLRLGTNRDSKRGVKSKNMKDIHWIFQCVPFEYSGNYHHHAKVPVKRAKLVKSSTPPKGCPASLGWLWHWNKLEKEQIAKEKQIAKKKTKKAKIV